MRKQQGFKPADIYGKEMFETNGKKKNISSILKLTLEEKIDIVHQHLLGLRTQREVAEGMGVKLTTVGNLVRKVKANNDYLQELRAKEINKQ